MALLWRGDREARARAAVIDNRLHQIFKALAAVGVSAEPAVYSEGVIDEVRDQLLKVDGVLVWVDPICEGRDRSRLDALLREVSARGIWVSAHPDVILKMGVKEVLYRTRSLGWGTDTHLYATPAAFKERFPGRLASSGPRVLKQNRGNGGLGVWKVEFADNAQAALGRGAVVRVLHARKGSQIEVSRLGDFLGRCDVYFEGAGRLIDQPFQPRLPEGMIRCYLSQGRVVGFGHQLIRALMPPPSPREGPDAAQPGPRIMSGADHPPFQALRTKMESEWVPAMTRLLDLDPAILPAIWDADFLYGPKTRSGADTYVLCEINVSSVFPIPDQAPGAIAACVARHFAAAKAPASGRRRTSRTDGLHSQGSTPSLTQTPETHT